MTALHTLKTDAGMETICGEPRKMCAWRYMGMEMLKTTLVSLVAFAVVGCSSKNTREETRFESHPEVECYTVRYFHDTIRISASVNGADTMLWRFYPKVGDYYCMYNGKPELVLSNKGRYVNAELRDGSRRHVRIQSLGDSLFVSKLSEVVGPGKRIKPVLTLLYDKNYKIRKIWGGSLTVEHILR